MDDSLKIFFADDIRAAELNEEIFGNNFASINRDIDGKRYKVPFESQFNVCEILRGGSDGRLTIIPNKSEIKVENNVLYLQYIGEARVRIFPTEFSPEDGIEIVLEIYARDGEDLAYALSRDDYPKIYLGEGLYPGFVVNRPLEIIGCGEKTRIIPYEEYQAGAVYEDYDDRVNGILRKTVDIRAELGGAFTRFDDDALDENKQLAYGLGMGEERGCNTDPARCVNNYINANEGVDYRERSLTRNSRKSYYNDYVCKNNMNEAIVRINSDNVVFNNMTILSINENYEFLIGVAVRSRSLNRELRNIVLRATTIAMPYMSGAGFAFHAYGVRNLELNDSMFDLDRAEENDASISICNIYGGRIDGFIANSRVFLGGNGCFNQIDFITRTAIDEDVFAFEGDGSELKYGDIPRDDVNGVVASILRDDSNRFDGLRAFSAEYPDYVGLYLGSKLSYAILINRNALR